MLTIVLLLFCMSQKDQVDEKTQISSFLCIKVNSLDMIFQKGFDYSFLTHEKAYANICCEAGEQR